jgi:hypothetical protein
MRQYAYRDPFAVKYLHNTVDRIWKLPYNTNYGHGQEE